MKHDLRHWFQEPGAYVLVDGQFGSTGKGLFASYLALMALDIAGKPRVTHVTTNAGPNSGHTAYYKGEKIVTQQVPIASAIFARMGLDVTTIFNAGAIIYPPKFEEEIDLFLGGNHPARNWHVHPCAAIIGDEDLFNEGPITKNIGSTGKGVGSAAARKIMRYDGNVASEAYLPLLPEGWTSWDDGWNWSKDVVLVETAQGFSLGINSARFYPHVTSRECTVMQAIADARIPAQMVRKVVACYRTYPIRVGGNSGECYPDQHETTWEALGVEPELTTVTKKVRRVFTWSRQQFRESVAANRPDVLFINFVNYVKREKIPGALKWVNIDYLAVMGRPPEAIFLGFSPEYSDIVSADEIVHDGVLRG